MVNVKKSIHLILFFTYGYSLIKWKEKGILDRELQLYIRLAEQGVNVTFITYGDHGDLILKKDLGQIEIVPVYCYFKKTQSKLFNLFSSFLIPFRLKLLFREAHILKTNQMWGAWVPLLVKWLYGKKLIVRCGYELYANQSAESIPFSRRGLLFALSSISYRLADKIILTSPSMASFVQKKFKIPEQKIITFQNNIDTNKFKCNKDFFEASNRVLFIGRLVPEKNIEVLIRACGQASIGLGIVGEGPLKNHLRDVASEGGVDVEFHGMIPNQEIPKVINHYRMFALISKYEGNPKTLLEAMSCSRAVIGTSVRGVKDIITQQENGLLCELSKNSIAEAITTLKNNPEYAAKLGINAREYIMNHNDLELAVKKETDLYQKILCSYEEISNQTVNR
jgi:glycosyltransferase involved in cell wall biosynthesis